MANNQCLFEQDPAVGSKPQGYISLYLVIVVHFLNLSSLS